MDSFNQFIELAGWPKDLDLIGRERLLSLWTFSCHQGTTGLRDSVFDKLITVLSGQEAQDWDEKEWMEVVMAIRSGSAGEKGRLAGVMCRRFEKRNPEVLGPLMTSLYAPETSESSADPEVMRSPNLGPEPSVADSVTGNPAAATPNLPPGAGNDNLCGPATEAALDSAVTATDGGVRLSVEAVSTDDPVIEVEDSDLDEPRPSTSRQAAAAAFEVELNNSSSLLTARARRSVAGNSNNKRKVPEEDPEANVSGRKTPRSELKQYSGVVQLSVSDIHGTTMEDGCIKVDTKKWGAIMKGCQPSAKIILPEGSFSFPPKYDFRPNRPGVTISGTSPDKTTICYHPPTASSAKPKKLTPSVIIGLWNKLTLENLTFRAKFPQENIWPRVLIFGDKCQVQNVTFYGCGLGIQSNRNEVDNLKFFGENDAAAISRLPTKDVSEGIYILTPGNSGNIVQNIYCQDLHFGIWKVQSGPRSERTDPGMTDLIENVNCRNVKFGVNLKTCKGAVMKNLSWHWDWKVMEEIRTEMPTAVQIHGGQENVVSGVTCQGSGKHFYGFVLNDEDNSGVPKKNKISCVKGASGRYWDNGEETELIDVEG